MVGVKKLGNMSSNESTFKVNRTWVISKNKTKLTNFLWNKDTFVYILIRYGSLRFIL